jgi:threonine/homoserine/homoserine lactone efflux protein
VSVKGAFLIQGLVVGFTIAAPVGPIGILCIRRTLAGGRLSGFVSGLGAATADAVYGSIAAFGLTSIAAFLIAHLALLRVSGGGFLVYVGWRIFFARGQERSPLVQRSGLAGDYVSTLLLTLTNPLTILSFAAVFTGLGLAGAGRDYGAAGLLVLGVFVGSGLWWALLSGLIDRVRRRVDLDMLRWVNRVSGGMIGGFGVVVIASALR